MLSCMQQHTILVQCTMHALPRLLCSRCMATYWCLAICRYGYRGFYDRDDKPVVLTRRSVDGIQLQGGTILGTSRGGADIKWGLQTLAAHAVNGSQPSWPATRHCLHICLVVLRLTGGLNAHSD